METSDVPVQELQPILSQPQSGQANRVNHAFYKSRHGIMQAVTIVLGLAVFTLSMVYSFMSKYPEADKFRLLFYVSIFQLTFSAGIYLFCFLNEGAANELQTQRFYRAYMVTIALAYIIGSSLDLAFIDLETGKSTRVPASLGLVNGCLFTVIFCRSFFERED